MCFKSLNTESIYWFLFQRKRFRQHEVRVRAMHSGSFVAFIDVHVFESMCNQDYHKSHIWRETLEMYSIDWYCISSVNTWVLLLTLSPAPSSLSQVSC